MEKQICHLFTRMLNLQNKIRKSETLLHISLHNHRKDIKGSSEIPGCKHLNSPKHDFNIYKKLEQLIELKYAQ